MTDFAFGSVGQAVAPVIGKAIKGAVTGFGKTGKATSEVLGALDTLSLIYIGGNVMKAKVTAKNGGKSNDA